MSKILAQLAAEIRIRPDQVKTAVELLDGGATVPFIARYRKEVTDGLDDIQLRELEARLGYLRELEDRRAAVIKSITEQGKMTPDLLAAIDAAPTKQELEDIYLPFKPKRRTKGMIAREAGLEPLADKLFADPTLDPHVEAQAFLLAAGSIEGADFTTTASVLDTRKDLAAVSLIGTSAMVLATFSGSEYKSFADVVAAAKAKKNVSYGSIGSGSLGHLAMALLSKSGNIDWQHVPYKGGGPLMTDAVAGHVPLSIGSVFVTKPHIDSGRMRPLAVTTSKRVPDLPNVPTVAESGFAGFDAPAWWAILAPAKTPPEVLKRMNEEINKALKNPEIAKKLDAQGIDIIGGTPAAADAFIGKQIDIWAKVVKDNGIKAD